MEPEKQTNSNTSAVHVSAGTITVHDWWKRPFDLLVLTVAHIALAPVWLALWTSIPLAIWLTDRGPVFYTQTRVGKGGKIFRAYKFRSMIPDAERYTGAVWAEEDDPRITWVGRILRNRALDELPQVINMWKGDISLVGPRPERPELVGGVYPKVAAVRKTTRRQAWTDWHRAGLWPILHPPPRQSSLRHNLYQAYVALFGRQVASAVYLDHAPSKVAGSKEIVARIGLREWRWTPPGCPAFR